MIDERRRLCRNIWHIIQCRLLVPVDLGWVQWVQAGSSGPSFRSRFSASGPRSSTRLGPGLI